MKKSFLLLLLVITSGFSLSGCLNSKKNDPNNPPPAVMYNDSGVVDKTNQPEEASYTEVSSDDELEAIEDDLKNTSINDAETSELEDLE